MSDFVKWQKVRSRKQKYEGENYAAWHEQRQEIIVRRAEPDAIPVEPREPTVAEEFMRELVDDLSVRMKLFSERQERVFWHCFVLGETEAKAGAVLGMDSHTVAEHKIRIREKIQEEIKKRGGRVYKKFTKRVSGKFAPAAL